MVFVIGYFDYTMFFQSTDGDSDLLISGTNSLSGNSNSTDVQILGNQITQALTQIGSLNLDRSVFESPVFRSLVDISRPIDQEPAGRRNPFAPLSDTSVNFDENSPSLDSESLDLDLEIPEDSEVEILEDVPDTSSEEL